MAHRQLKVDFAVEEETDLNVFLDTSAELFLRCRPATEYAFTVVNQADPEKSVMTGRACSQSNMLAVASVDTCCAYMSLKMQSMYLNALHT